MNPKCVFVKRVTGIIIIFSLLIIVVTFFAIRKPVSIQNFVKDHSDKLTQYAESMIQTGSNGKRETYGDYEMTYWATTNMVEFVARKNGIGSSTVYEGFYYSPDDKPLGFQGNQVQFTESDSGWIWKESNGDNWEYTEKIQEHWYWFEFHF